MKLYYIDDSMFQQTQFATQVLHRFECILEQNLQSLVLISITKEDNKLLERFLLTYKNTSVLLSPTLFDYDTIRGNLHTTFLAVEGFPIMESYSGSCVEYDTDTMKARRLYLELFLDYDDYDVDSIVKEMEKILSDTLHFVKKKTNLN